MQTAKRVDCVVPRGSGVRTILVDQTVTEAAIQMRDHGIGCLVVIGENEKIFGILSEQDIVRHVVASRRDPDTVTVSEIMTHNVIACTPRTDIARAQQIMAQRGVRHLPIAEDGRFEGMLSSRDIMAEQLTSVRAQLEEQSSLLSSIEQSHPGITRLRRDGDGRIIL